MTRPSVLPSRVIARVDETATPVRLIAVDKTALPAGSSINTATGAVTTPLGVVVTGIAGVTLNGAPFVNTGQFALSGNRLVFDPNRITQPAVGVTDTYVVTISNFGGGTTLVTVNVSRGSVRIDSIVVSNGVPAEVPPVMGDVPNQTATVGSAFSLNVAPAVTLTNGDAVTAYTLSGTLPTGLSFNSTTGIISGTPTQTGSFNLSVTAADNDGVSNSDAFTLTVNAAQVPPVMGNVPNQTATAGSAFSLNVAPSVTLTNGDAVSSYTLSGTLPTGLSFNSTTGVLSGTPTQTGSFNLLVTATDNDGISNSDAFSLTVNAAQVPPVMGNVPNQTATAGSVFSLNVAPAVTLTNGDAVTAYTLTGTLPTGLTFNTATGVLSGTPTQTGSFNLSVTATDNDGISNSDVFTLTVSAAEVPPVMGDVPNQTATAGSAFSLNVASSVTLTNGDAVSAYTLTGTLPTGLSFNSTTGVISGTPTQTGSFNLSVTATDNDGISNSDAFTLTVSAAEVPPVMGDVANQTATAGSAFSLNVAPAVTLTNGDAVSTYTLTGALPTGVTFNSTTGIISGTPTQTGSFNLAVTATDNDGISNSDAFTLTVSAAEVPPIMGDVANQTATAGSAFSLNVAPAVTLTNGDAVSTYTLSGSLPTGLSFNSATGILSGTPTQTGSFNLSVTATDNDGVSNSDGFTLTVNAAPDSTPDAFDIPNLTNQTINTVVTTGAITVAGINTASTATTTVGTIVKNGLDTGSASTMVNIGDTLAVKLTTSGSYATAVNGVIDIG